jgi:hypothetical protein
VRQQAGYQEHAEQFMSIIVSEIKIRPTISVLAGLVSLHQRQVAMVARLRYYWCTYLQEETVRDVTHLVTHLVTQLLAQLLA